MTNRGRMGHRSVHQGWGHSEKLAPLSSARVSRTGGISSSESELTLALGAFEPEPPVVMVLTGFKVARWSRGS
jgi:hypothetical protein